MDPPGFLFFYKLFYFTPLHACTCMLYLVHIKQEVIKLEHHKEFVDYYKNKLITKGDILTRYNVKSAKFDADLYHGKIKRVTTIGRVNLYDQKEIEKFYGGIKK